LPGRGIAIFDVPATNGFKVTVFAEIPSFAGGSGGGTAVVIAENRRAREFVSYQTSDKTTGRSIDIELGDLGRIEVETVPTGRKHPARVDCKAPPRQVPGYRYEGTIEFHGEEGFTEAKASTVPFDYATYGAFACGIPEGAVPEGKPVPGAFLSVSRGSEEPSLHVLKLRPGAPTLVSVEMQEVRDGIEIHRAAGIRAGAAAFSFRPDLSAATVALPAPFSGHATYRRDAPAAKRWTGNLSVDLPGEADLPLTGPGFDAEMRQATANNGY
jgi:hypothetical protein